MLASCMMDPVLGLDTHIVLVPTPAGPVPTPMPMPFIGMVFDPIALALGAAMNSLTLVNGMLGTNVGTAVTNKLTMPHLPVPGPFAVPPGMDAEIRLGSYNVSVGGCFAARLGDLAWSCGDPQPAPTSVVLAIPKGPLVLIQRPPAPDLAFMATQLIFGLALHALGALAKGLFKALRSLQRGVAEAFFKDLSSKLHVEGAETNRASELWNDAVCFLTGHPVDVATGRLITSAVDLDLPGALPLRFERRYDTAASARPGPLGAGWSHNFNQAIWPERGAIVVRGADGREVEFSTLHFPDYVLTPGRSIYNQIERLTLSLVSVGVYRLESHDGLVREFSEVPGGERRVAKLTRLRNRLGQEQRYRYDARGQLEAAFDPAGRALRFQYDDQGRIARLDAFGSDGQGQHIASYAYSPEGDLIQVNDALGNPFRYEYVEHLLVQETNRNGLSFYFQYDGIDSSAKCVRTWGDGGIYDHVITYDTKASRTLVENSLGAVTLYQMNEFGQVISIIDALGAETKYEYEHASGQKTKETDPMGATTRYEYDAAGNLTKTVDPDGAVLAIEHNELNLPLRALDAMGGEWRWGYDYNGRLIGRIDPLDRRTQFEWQGGQVMAVIDAAGHATRFSYDESGNLASLTAPNGATSQWHYDAFGRPSTTIDPRGNLRRRQTDALGRVTRIAEPDGNVRELSYDGESNILRTVDKQYDVRFEYRGMNRLAARSQAGTRVEFQYDTEDQLIALKNEHGLVYRFVLDLAGAVQEEYGFDELRRRYVRDAGGRVAEVNRPGGRKTKYQYDAAGRVVGVAYGDGSKEAYEYRADGELVAAVNDAATVKFERDALGSIIRELQGDDWVSSEYDTLGFRVRTRSSKGLDQRIARNGMGDVLSLRAWVNDSEAAVLPGIAGSSNQSSPFEAAFKRDELGLELERSLPGGVRAQWQRDSLGRPVRQEIWSGNQFQGARQYSWDVNGRLKSIFDAMSGPVHFTHDALGNLAAASYADGSVDLRMPDAVGNLFRTSDRSDRKYGRAGELLEARDAAGVTRYEYDAEGNLSKKTEPSGAVWTYDWNGAGMLDRVLRPDGTLVQFTYDALGRRVSKSHGQRTTRWLWDGNVVLHEWIERARAPETRDTSSLTGSSNVLEIAAKRREAIVSAQPAQGPPPASAGDTPITWLFEPDSFVPIAKLVGGERFGIVTDHLGTPLSMFDSAGQEAWHGEIDGYGQLRNTRGEPDACPFRWQGQYQDSETGLYYNRFRYYDPAAGEYVSQDPIALEGGQKVYCYASDVAIAIDPLGLSFYRGARPGEDPNFAPRPNDVKLDSGGRVAPTKGVSVFDNPTSVESKGFVPHEVDASSVPDTLTIKQRGKDPKHFEIMPKEPMAPDDFKEELDKIKTKPVGCA